MIPEPNSWSSLAQWLRTNTPDVFYPDALPEERRFYCDSQASCWTELVMAERAHKQAIEKAARDFAEMMDLVWMGLDEAAKKWFAMRVEVARTLVESFATDPPHACVFPYPTAPLAEVLAWLLIDWWQTEGSQHAAYKMLEHWPNPIQKWDGSHGPEE